MLSVKSRTIQIEYFVDLKYNSALKSNESHTLLKSVFPLK